MPRQRLRQWGLGERDGPRKKGHPAQHHYAINLLQISIIKVLHRLIACNPCIFERWHLPVVYQEADTGGKLI